MKCPYCNAEISDDSLFCGSCGKKLPQQKECVRCGKIIDVNSDFCPYCGAKQNPSASAQIESEPPSEVKRSVRTSKTVSVIVGSILVLAVLCGAAYYWFEIREDYSLERLAKITTGEYELFNFDNGYAAIKIGDKMGVINKQGDIVAPIDYIFHVNFNSSHFISYAIMIEERMRLAKKVNDKKKFGYIDKDGKEVIPFIYDGATSFSNGLALVSKNCRKPGCMYIDKAGKVVLSFDDYFSNYGLYSEEGLALIGKNGKWGLMDKTGTIVTDCMYDKVEGYSEGYYQVMRNGKAGFVDKKGKEAIPCKYDATLKFQDGVANVCIDWDENKWSMIDTDGNILIQKCNDIGDFYEGVAVVRKNDRSGYVDKTGKEVIPLIYESAQCFSEGFAAVKKEGLWGYIDKNGNEAIPIIYEEAKDFSDGLARVKKDGMWGYIDKNGKSTFDYQ